MKQFIASTCVQVLAQSEVYLCSSDADFSPTADVIQFAGNTRPLLKWRFTSSIQPSEHNVFSYGVFQYFNIFPRCQTFLRVCSKEQHFPPQQLTLFARVPLIRCKVASASNGEVFFFSTRNYLSLPAQQRTSKNTWFCCLRSPDSPTPDRHWTVKIFLYWCSIFFFNWVAFLSIRVFICSGDSNINAGHGSLICCENDLRPQNRERPLHSSPFPPPSTFLLHLAFLTATSSSPSLFFVLLPKQIRVLNKEYTTY